MASSGRSTAAAVTGGMGTQPTPANNVDGNSTRRESQGTLFSGLVNQKRGSGDANSEARRASFADQKPATGILGTMWNNFTTGSK